MKDHPSIILVPADKYRASLMGPRHPAFVATPPAVYRRGDTWSPPYEVWIGHPAAALPLFWDGQLVRDAIGRLADVVLNDCKIRDVEAWRLFRVASFEALEIAIARLCEYREGQHLGEFVTLPPPGECP